MRGQSGGSPSYPTIEAEFGYNPAHFLDGQIGRIDCTADLTVVSLIRGIEEVSAIRAWLTIEANLRRGRNGGPRQQVVKWLNRRQVQILEADRVPSTATDDKGRTQSPGEETTTHRSEPASDNKPTETPPTPPEIPARATTIATDGGAPSISRCPDCHGELTPEMIGDETVHWCSYCSGFREPIEGEA